MNFGLHALDRAKTKRFDCFMAYEAVPGAETSRGVSSDRIALDLANGLNAEHLILIKSGAIDPTASVAELSRTGIVHRSFESTAKRAGFPVSIVQSNDLARMRSLLHGDVEPTIAM